MATFRQPRTRNEHGYWKNSSRRDSSNMIATRLIFISNFRLLVQRFCHILTNFLVALHLNIIYFPRSKYQNSASFSLFSGTSALRRLFNHWCVYCITCHALWALFVFPPSSNPLFDSKLKNHYLRAFFTVVSSYTWRWWFAQKYNHYCVRYRA